MNDEGSYLKVSRCHVTSLPSPHALLASLVQGALQLLTEPLGVLAPLVLGHAEQDCGGIGG